MGQWSGESVMYTRRVRPVDQSYRATWGIKYYFLRSSLGRSLQSVEINFHECIDLPRQVGQYSFISGSLYSVMST